MKKVRTLLIIALCFALIAPTFVSCTRKENSTPVAIENFRVTAYVVASTLDDEDFDASHFKGITDIILFGCADFDENGNVILSEKFDYYVTKLKSEVNDDTKRIHINFLGPSLKTESDDWNKNMKEKAKLHKTAFESGKLEQQIVDIVTKYDFDGVFFDYEYPIRSNHWKVYSNFLVSLDNALDQDTMLGVALAAWDVRLSKQAKEVVDMVELMSYDLWDESGNHATMEIAKDDIEKMVKAGYDKSKIDLGIPFYARPTTKEAYWYEQKSYYNLFDENGLYNDDKTGLTFSFNTPLLVEEKTRYAVHNGIGGVMVWHYACDLPANNENSLFNSIQKGIKS